MLWSIYNYFLNIFFPKVCFVCKKKNESLCDSCLKKCVRSIDAPYLYILNTYSFRDPIIKKAIHSIKYYHRRDLIEPLTKEIAREAIKYRDFILVPIPMPKMRKYIRGYNQAELIAQEISKKTGLVYNHKLIKRNRYTKRQVESNNKSERLKNQHNSFEVIANVQNLKIILVDDVTTTGSTIKEIREVLLKSGASDVKAVTIAH